MRSRSKAALAALFCLAALEGCRTPPRPAAPPGPLPPAPAVAPGRAYGIIAERSLVQILVFRAGALAMAGHNHVIASHELGGSITLATDPAQSSFELRLPVATLTVDEPGLRAALGAEFPPDVPPSAREGTRRNMLSPAVLDAERHPWLVLRSERLEATREGFDATVRIELRGQTHGLRVPLRYELSGEELRVTTEFAVKQTELGLTPFSTLLGALQVADELRVSAHIVARACTLALARGASGSGCLP